MISVSCKAQDNWLSLVLGSLKYLGCAVVTDVLRDSRLTEIQAAMYRVEKIIRDTVGVERLARAGEMGVLRIMMKHDPIFLSLLEIPELLAVVDKTVSSTAILHLQNGFILPSCEAHETPSVFQNALHMDFRRLLNGYMASVNALLTISEFTRENGGTVVVPGSHQRTEILSEELMEAATVPVECPAGSLIVFDSTLWHAAGVNTSGDDRLGINHQFTRSFFKQQIDYVRALGASKVEALPARTQQLLGWYTRVVTDLDEYYRPEHERLYRAGQG